MMNREQEVNGWRDRQMNRWICEQRKGRMDRAGQTHGWRDRGIDTEMGGWNAQPLEKG